MNRISQRIEIGIDATFKPDWVTFQIPATYRMVSPIPVLEQPSLGLVVLAWIA